LANKYKRRTLRALNAQTQAYPIDMTLDSGFDRTQGALSGANAITGAKAAILPGMVAALKATQIVTVCGAQGASPGIRPVGLFAQFVGGEMSDIPSDFDKVGVWRGAGSTFEVLAPAFDDTNLATDAAAQDGSAAKEVYLISGTKGQLGDATAGAYAVNRTARLIDRLSANAIIVELLV